MEDKKTEKGNTNRRNFLKLGLMSSVTAVAGASIISNLASDEEAKPSGEKMRLLTPDGKIVEVDASNVNKYPEALITPEESRKGIPNRKFVMVIDLAKCKNARKCVEGCQKAHNLDYNEEFINLLASLSEVDFIILDGKDLDSILQKITPQAIYETT